MKKKKKKSDIVRLLEWTKWFKNRMRIIFLTIKKSIFVISEGIYSMSIFEIKTHP